MFSKPIWEYLMVFTSSKVFFSDYQVRCEGSVKVKTINIFDNRSEMEIIILLLYRTRHRRSE
jgi:hypothetical protein